MMVIDFLSWSWPQWIMVALITLNFCIVCTFHGSLKHSRKYDIRWAIVNLAVLLPLLSFGGFFSGAA